MRSLPLLQDEVDNLPDLPRRRVVAFFQFRFLDVDLRRRLHAEHVVDPRRIDRQADVDEHEKAVFLTTGVYTFFSLSLSVETNGLEGLQAGIMLTMAH